MTVRKVSGMSPHSGQHLCNDDKIVNLADLFGNVKRTRISASTQISEKPGYFVGFSFVLENGAVITAYDEKVDGSPSADNEIIRPFTCDDSTGTAVVQMIGIPYDNLYVKLDDFTAPVIVFYVDGD